MIINIGIGICLLNHTVSQGFNWISILLFYPICVSKWVPVVMKCDEILVDFRLFYVIPLDGFSMTV